MILALACPLLVAACTSALIWYKYPGTLLKYIFRLSLYSSGLKLKYANIGKYQYCIAERGKKRSDKLSMVLIHGFSASKDMWVPIVKKLPKDTHIVIIDLPGHGDTTIPSPEDDISIYAMTDYVHEVLCYLKMDETPFHLVGASLGGAIAGLYGATYPKQVAKLTLMCPAMKTPVETEFLQEIRAGICRLIPKTPDELQHMLDSCMHFKKKLNKQILTGILELRSPKNDFYQKLYEHLQEEEKKTDAIDFLTKITAPTHVMWGEHDELIHVSGAELLQEYLQHCQRVDIIENCGHSLNLDRPGMVVKCLLEFRGELISTKQNKLD